MKKNKLKLLIMLVVISLFIVACGSENKESGNTELDYIEITDMYNRNIKIENNVERIFSTMPTGTIILYTLDPDKLIGWNYDLREEEKYFILEKYHSLPNLGGAGRNPINIEELLTLNPDVIIIMEELSETSLEKAEEMENKLGKPVILLDSNLSTLDEAYYILGQITGQGERASKLSSYVKETMDYALEQGRKIDEADKVRVYYAQGNLGLETDPSGSWHAEIIDIVGGINVAEVEISGDYGKTQVSIEQLLKWNPDLIISWGDERGGYYSQIFQDASWGEINAVKNMEVFEIPNRPFNWFDRPVSVNRILGVKWMGNLLYPEIYDYNIEDVVSDFYELFYGYSLSDEEIEDLTKNAIRK